MLVSQSVSLCSIGNLKSLELLVLLMICVPDAFPLKVGSGNDTTSNGDEGDFQGQIAGTPLSSLEVVSFPDPTFKGNGSGTLLPKSWAC